MSEAAIQSYANWLKVDPSQLHLVCEPSVFKPWNEDEFNKGPFSAEECEGFLKSYLAGDWAKSKDEIMFDEETVDPEFRVSLENWTSANEATNNPNSELKTDYYEMEDPAVNADFYMQNYMSGSNNMDAEIMPDGSQLQNLGSDYGTDIGSNQYDLEYTDDEEWAIIAGIQALGMFQEGKMLTKDDLNKALMYAKAEIPEFAHLNGEYNTEDNNSQDDI